MLSKLKANLEPNQLSELNGSYMSGRFFREQVVLNLDKDIERLRHDMENDEGFDSPNWQLAQVERLAQIKAYKQMKKYLE